MAANGYLSTTRLVKLFAILKKNLNCLKTYKAQACEAGGLVGTPGGRPHVERGGDTHRLLGV